MLKIKLRPHHALCISFFEGKGYSTEFVENMKEAIQKLNENTVIQLTDDVDAICAACPNNFNNQCVYDIKVNRYDEAVKKICLLETNQSILWSEIFELVNTYIIKPKLLHTICGDCEWSSICLRNQKIN
jgi:hypothetical protein